MSEQKHVVAVGNTRSLILFRLRQSDGPVSLSGLTVKVVGEQDDSDVWFAERTTGVTAEPTYTFTADATTNKLAHNKTPAQNGDEVVLTNSGGALPAGLAASTRYFVVSKEPNAFQVSLTPDGPPVDITGTGTGTHSYAIVGSVSVDLQTADVTTSGTFWLWVNVYDGSEYDTFPIVDESRNRGFKAVIVEPS